MRFESFDLDPVPLQVPMIASPLGFERRGEVHGGDRHGWTSLWRGRQNPRARKEVKVQSPNQNRVTMSPTLLRTSLLLATPVALVSLILSPSSANVPVHPGDRVDGVGPPGNLACTLGLALSGSDGHNYFATAGHCAPEVGTFPAGHPARPKANGQDLGAFVWAEFVDRPAERDLALIRVDPVGAGRRLRAGPRFAGRYPRRTPRDEGARGVPWHRP